MAEWPELQNLPDESAPPALGPSIAEMARLAAMCPHGWVELLVEQGRTASTPDAAPEGYQDVQAVCVWGVGPDIAERLDELIEEATADGSALSRVPAGAFMAIARVVDGGDDVSLDVGWGVGGAAVYSLLPEDDAPPVCGGCFAVGLEPHAFDCPDERIRRDQEDRLERGELNDPTDLGDEEGDHG